MAETSTIEWTDATWNPVTGCSVVSPGCTNCYAMRLAGKRMKHHESRAGLTIPTKAGPVWNGQVRLNEQWLDQPLRWKRRRMIFVCAHGDLFHEAVPDEWIDRIFAVMALCPQHTFQVLTKRSARMREYCIRPGTAERISKTMGSLACELSWPRIRAGIVVSVSLLRGDGWPLPNVWLGVSAERQQEADERVPDLLATPAAIRFVSAEPLLGPVDFENFCDGVKFIDALRGNWMHDCEGPYIERGKPKLDWIIVGGESGKGARPMHPDWARSIRDQCAEAGVPFFFKQWGEWQPLPQWLVGDGGDYHKFEDGTGLHRSGKKVSGRQLDGVEHNGMPGR
ncbi:MAG: phage Gp37/Gp68 family protein [Flavobacteriaceae bacterium]